MWTIAALIIVGYVSPLWLIVYVVLAPAEVVSRPPKCGQESRVADMVFAVFPVMFLIDVAGNLLGLVHSATGRRIRSMDRHGSQSAPLPSWVIPTTSDYEVFA
jgi:hypothetical protein